jgi:hypothetical protein
MNLGLRATARELGISHVALLKAARVGRVRRGDDGRFDLEAVRRDLEATVSRKRPQTRAVITKLTRIRGEIDALIAALRVDVTAAK